MFDTEDYSRIPESPIEIVQDSRGGYDIVQWNYLKRKWELIDSCNHLSEAKAMFPQAPVRSFGMY